MKYARARRQVPVLGLHEPLVPLLGVEQEDLHHRVRGRQLEFPEHLIGEARRVPRTAGRTCRVRNRDRRRRSRARAACLPGVEVGTMDGGGGSGGLGRPRQLPEARFLQRNSTRTRRTRRPARRAPRASGTSGSAAAGTGIRTSRPAKVTQIRQFPLGGLSQRANCFTAARLASRFVAAKSKSPRPLHDLAFTRLSLLTAAGIVSTVRRAALHNSRPVSGSAEHAAGAAVLHATFAAVASDTAFHHLFQSDSLAPALRYARRKRNRSPRVTCGTVRKLAFRRASSRVRRANGTASELALTPTRSMSTGARSSPGRSPRLGALRWAL